MSSSRGLTDQPRDSEDYQLDPDAQSDSVLPTPSEPKEHSMVTELVSSLTSALERVSESDRHSPAIRAPRRFNGRDPKDLSRYLDECQIVFSLRPKDYSTDKKKVAYASLYLLDSVRDSYVVAFRTGDPRIETWDGFVTWLKAMFGEPFPEVAATERLIRSSQRTSESMTEYVARFRSDLYLLDWTDATAFNIFLLNMNGSVRRHLSHNAVRPPSFELLTRAAIEADKVLRDVPPARSAATSHSRPSSSFQSKPTTAAYNSSNPKAKTLSYEEKARRLKERLCLFCESDSHLLPDCTRCQPPRDAEQRQPRDKQATPLLFQKNTPSFSPSSSGPSNRPATNTHSRATRTDNNQKK